MEDGGRYYHHHQYHQHGEQRFLAELWGVDEDGGLYVLIAGIILVGLTAISCFYCKVYDPLRTWILKKIKQCCTKKPKEAVAEPETQSAEERRHWYLNRTLKIDREDREELGPRGLKTGLQGGWYGARNGGFDNV